MGTDALLVLQGLRDAAPDLLNTLMIAMSWLGEGVVPTIIIALVLWCVDKRAGFVLLANYTVCLCVNQLVKITACVYRPWILDPNVVPEAAALPGATGYSFPSGHTTVATSFCAPFALWQRRRRWVVALMVALVALIAFSRCWLGCHTPADVLVALVLSFAAMGLVHVALGVLDRHPNWDVAFAAVMLLVAVGALVYCSLKSYPLDYDATGALLVDPWVMQQDCFKAMGGLAGMAVGWLLERRLIHLTAPADKRTMVLRGVVGMVLVLVLYAGLSVLLGMVLDSHWSHFVTFCVCMLMVTAGCPAIFMAHERRVAAA